MKKLIVELNDINKTDFLKQFGHIVFVSRIMNYVILEAKEESLEAIKAYDNVVSVNISQEGFYQPTKLVCV